MSGLRGRTRINEMRFCRLTVDFRLSDMIK
jgi:hypothetical protein